MNPAPTLDTGHCIQQFYTCGSGLACLQVVMTRYAHASNKLLGIQIDAAINPGKAAALQLSLYPVV